MAVRNTAFLGSSWQAPVTIALASGGDTTRCWRGLAQNPDNLHWSIREAFAQGD
ncbi:MAG: hypothetical protein ACSLEN_07870 [Candidatus Malihini olakiniferum]